MLSSGTDVKFLLTEPFTSLKICRFQNIFFQFEQSEFAFVNCLFLCGVVLPAVTVYCYCFFSLYNFVRSGKFDVDTGQPHWSASHSGGG